MTSPYRDAAEQYWEAGWLGPIPLPRKAKKDPPAGFTGQSGVYPSRADIQTWMDNGHAGSNIALRLPDDVIGIDVDCYDGKQGAVTLAELEARWGPLPPTWISSSRNDGSGIRFFRVPPGRRWPSVPGPGIEIIQRAHRYAVVWPSVHPEGRPYVWVGRLGIPGPRHLPLLPERWVDGLSEVTGAERTTGWTDPHLDDLIEHGIPAGVNQDEALRDVVWKLRGAEVGRMATYVVWYSIVAKTLLTRSGEPWTMRDFDRHWAGADAKMPAPLTVLEPPPAAKPDSPLLTRSQLRSLPAPEPLIENTIDLRTVALVAGYWGTLKSFIALDWAACIATGKPWMGRDIKQGPVLYVAAEGAYGIGPRLDAWEYAWWQSRLVPDDMFAVYPRPINLLDITQVATLVALADGRRFVVVDTLARCLVGGDEDKARDMGVAVDALYKVRNATRDGTVAVLHHTGKDKVTTRGSSALEAGVDTVYATEGGAERVTLTRMKRKDGPVEDKLDLTLHKHLESGVISIHTGAGQTDNEKKLLSTMLSSFALTGASKADLRNASGLAPASFHRALQALLYGGFIRDAGSERRPFYRIGDPQ